MKFIPDLYLQGLLAQDAENITCMVLESNFPTTLVDMARLHVKQTPLFPTYKKLQKEYQDWCATQLEEDLQSYMHATEKSAIERQSSVFRRVDTVAPMVQALFDDIWNIPLRLREAYVQQWRRWLVRRAVAFINFVKEERYG
ncbi:hypothetical protein BX666DRAFT_1866528 [Dichotomocladium elegans]|nr:hypothetical protein BX666DRAFT_1866528 [Dichotomocladium elegans]